MDDVKLVILMQDEIRKYFSGTGEQIDREKLLQALAPEIEEKCKKKKYQEKEP